MRDLVNQTFAGGILGLSVVGGGISSFLGYLQNNAAAYGLILSFFFGCAGLWISWYKNNKPAENAEEIAELKRVISAIEERKREK